MTSLKSIFVHAPSPSHSEDIISENGMSTLPISDRDGSICENFINSNKSTVTSTYQKFLQNNRPFMKGRNTFAFWTIISLLFILTIGNLLLTITIFSVLRLSKGMNSMETIPEQDVIKFFGTTDLDRIYKRDGNIEGFFDEPVTITGDAASFVLNLIHRNGHSHNKIIFDENGINLKGLNAFETKDPITGEVIFTTHRPHYNILKDIGKLNAKLVSTSRITSPIHSQLEMNADKIVIRGSEGITLEGEEILFFSEDKITINNTMGSTYLISSNDGIYLNMDKIPVINSEHGIRSANVQYKICVCMPQGILYKLPIYRGHNNKITCAHFNSKNDPCII